MARGLLYSLGTEPHVFMGSAVLPAPDSGLKCPVIINPTWGLGLGWFVCFLEQ